MSSHDLKTTNIFMNKNTIFIIPNMFMIVDIVYDS